MFDKIYSITLYENGRWCWKTSIREKTIEDYKRGEGFVYMLIVLILFSWFK